MAISYEQHRGKSPHRAAKRLGAVGSRIPKLNLDMLTISGRKIKAKEIIFFTSQLSLMLEVGTPLTSSLTAIENQTKNPAFKEVIRAMGKDIEEGLQLSDAMRRHPQVFNSVFISMIKAGETGGFLQKILDLLAEMQEKRQALIAQLRSTLTYPAILFLVGLWWLFFFLVGVLPKFTSFFAGKESILPVTTRFLMVMSKSLQGYWWGYLISIAGAIVALMLWKESQHGQALIDRFCVSAPVVARMYNKIYTCQLRRTLGHLMSSQVPLLEALEVTRPPSGIDTSAVL